MVFAELLGGMINRGGEHFREAELRKHALQNWQRENDLQLTSNFLTQNYGNLSPDQISSLTGRIEKLTGAKPGSWAAAIPAAQAIHQFLPPQPSAPELGTPRQAGEVTATPSTEAPTTIAPSNFKAPIQTKYGAVAPSQFAGQSIAAPANIQIGQVPTPAETATPSIFAPQPGQMVRSEPRLQLTPNQIAARQRTEQDQADLEQKVNNIMSSPYLDERSKMVAIRSLYTPPGVIAAEERQVSGPSSTALGVTWLESPDGKKRIGVQATRGGGYIDSSTGKPVDPTSIAGWTKVYDQPVQVVPNAGGTYDVINKGKLGKTMREEGKFTGTLPDVHAAQGREILYDNQGRIVGDRGTRTSDFRPYVEGVGFVEQPGAAPPNVNYAPPQPPGANAPARTPSLSDVRKTPMTTAEAKEVASLDKDEEFVRNFGALFNPEFVGPIQARWDNLMANSPEFARNLMGYKGSAKLSDFRVASAKLLNTVVKFITGAQMGEKEAERIKKEVPTPEMQPEDWKAAYAQTLDSIQMMKERMIEMGRWPSTLPQTNANRPAPAVGRGRNAPTAGGRGATATTPADANDTVNIKLPDGQTGTIPRANLAEAKRRGAVEVP